MQIRIIPAAAGFLLAALPVLAAAQDDEKYRCTFGDLERRIEIFRETGVSVPCEVHYYKDTEAPGQQQVLWRAQSEEGYCEARVEEFLRQLSDWGWSCDAGAPAADAAVDEAAIEEAAPDELPTDESVD